MHDPIDHRAAAERAAALGPDPTRRLGLAAVGLAAAAAAGAGAFMLPATAQAEEASNYPSRSIRIVVPYPPGGFNDTLGRIVAKKLGDAWKQPVIVDNKPGAGTMIGTKDVALAPADGYTLLVIQFPFAANPWLYKSMPYDSAKAFAPVLLAGRSPMLLAAHAASPAKSAADVIAAAKARPGELNYGSSGSGSSNHLAMALFESLTGTRLNQVPYKGSTPLLTDLAGGQVEFAFDALPHVLPFIHTGKVKALAVGSPQRTPLMPDVPTMAEAGIQGYEVSSWHGFVVAAGTPAPIVAKLNAQLNAVLAMPDVRELFRQQGVTPDGGTPAQFQTFIDGQMALWKRVVQQAHITLD